jgi:hypothetical protein
MSLAVFRYSQGLAGIFELPVEAARRLVPAPIEPVEVHHGTGALLVSANEYVESVFGPFSELIVSVLVAPLIRPGDVVPHAAFSPITMATTTPAARAQAVPGLHFPYWPDDVSIAFGADGGRHSVSVSVGGATLLEMSVHECEWEELTQRYQLFAVEAGVGGCRATLSTRGPQSDNEDGQGDLKLLAHAFYRGLDVSDVDPLPMRETCLKDGTRTLVDIVPL